MIETGDVLKNESFVIEGTQDVPISGFDLYHSVLMYQKEKD